jgi:hypothetical protein
MSAVYTTIMKKNGESKSLLLSMLLWGMVIGWIIFSALFTIFSYGESIYFAFDKVPGHYFSLPIQLTIVIFISLLIFYGLFINFLLKENYVQRVVLLSGVVTLFICLIAAFFTYPVGALDLFNYVLMGKLLVFYHQNPFIIPFTTVGSHDALQKYAIFLNVTTGYGPWWLFLTGFVVLLSGTSSILSMILTYKVMTLFFFCMTGIVLYLIPEKKSEKIIAAATYLFNPFIIFEGVVNAHNDILVAFFLILSWWAYKRKNIGLFLFIILAGLIKLYALALLPFFLFLIIKDKWKVKELFLSLFAAGVCFILLYLPYWDHGGLVNGVVLGLHNAQTINGYSLYSLCREYLITNSIETVFLSLVQPVFIGIFLCVSISMIFAVAKSKQYLDGCISLLLAFFLCVTIYQPWYILPVLAFSSLSPKKSDRVFSLSISAGALLSYPFSVWAWFHSGWSVLSIHFFLASFIALPSLGYLIYLFKKSITVRNTVQD